MGIRRPAGVVVDFQNGINDERVAALAGRERCLGCVITIGAGMYEPGHAIRTDRSQVGFGDARPDLGQERRECGVRAALGPNGRLKILQVARGYQKESSFHHIDGLFPLVRLEDPGYESRLIDVAALKMVAEPFRPPVADVRGLTGRFEFTGDSLWWKGARVAIFDINGDGVLTIDRQALVEHLLADGTLAGVNVELARPGDSALSSLSLKVATGERFVRLGADPLDRLLEPFGRASPTAAPAARSG